MERHPQEARRRGLRLWRGDFPAAEPAYIYQRQLGRDGWFLLHDDGTVTDVTFEETHRASPAE